MDNTIVNGIDIAWCLHLFYGKNLQNYHYYKLKNKPILKGIDTYDLVKDDFEISVALEDLR